MDQENIWQSCKYTVIVPKKCTDNYHKSVKAPLLYIKPIQGIQRNTRNCYCYRNRFTSPSAIHQNYLYGQLLLFELVESCLLVNPIDHNPAVGLCSISPILQ